MLASRFSRLLVVAMPLAFLTVHSSQTSGESDRPNIILFLADDLGAGDLASTGHPYVKTPSLDTFASQSLSISNAYSAGTWCAPSRYALMRGQYPGRGFYKDLTLDPGEPTITSFLKANGYTTAHIGKWHLKGEDYQGYEIDFHYAINGPENAVAATNDLDSVASID
ncbi:MAG: hypothetical protein CBD18_03865 [Opitutales bacterium TMED158]|nr:MAG: hypothetical protein CBD18_03865 [Opitutales bacterium TMED158]